MHTVALFCVTNKSPPTDSDCLARIVLKAPKSYHITPILRSLHWLKIKERIEYKLFLLTYKVLTTSQPDYLLNLISVQSACGTRSLSAVNLARPSLSSSFLLVHLILHITSSQSPPCTFAVTIYPSLGFSLQI